MSPVSAGTLDEIAVPFLGWGRIALGAGMAVAPRQFLRRTMFVRQPDVAAVALLRGFGVRDAVVGAGIVWADQSGDAAVRARWLLAGAACDAADAVAMIAGRRLPALGRTVWVLGATGAAALGVAAAMRARA